MDAARVTIGAQEWFRVQGLCAIRMGTGSVCKISIIMKRLYYKGITRLIMQTSSQG